MLAAQVTMAMYPERSDDYYDVVTQNTQETVVDVLFYSLLRYSLSLFYFYFLSLGIAYTHMRVLQKSVYFKVWVSFQLYFGLFGFVPFWDVYHMLADEHMSPPLCVLSKELTLFKTT